ncbi:MAG: hypothetical protein H6Q38_1932, partial [Chloroflexi bacterium]|nr:hypothetical protein [Chloroflexota bacterium]
MQVNQHNGYSRAFSQPANRPSYPSRVRRLAGFTQLVLLIFILSQIIPLPASLAHAADLSGDKQVRLGGETGASNLISDPRALPPDMVGLVEIVERRTPNSATFQYQNGAYTTLISNEAIHYQDDQGNWQILDVAFRPYEDSYVVESNSLHGRAGRRQAWLSAVVGETALSWQADTLGTVSTDNKYQPLARALPGESATAHILDDDRTLLYSGGWDLPWITEKITSAPHSLEHSVLLSQPLPVTDTPDYLELQASLELLPGSELLTDGQPFQGETSAQTLTVLDTNGVGTLAFEPIQAFEQNHRENAVRGEYLVRPGEESGSYRVSLRFPWSWLTDPAREYPLVLDPTMKVLKSTGYADGMAWVRNTGDLAYTLGGIRLGAYLPDWNTQTRGYVQFNSLPAMLTNTAPPLKITKATLEVEPILPAAAMPLYSNSPVDWEHEIIQRKTELYYVGACPNPNDPACMNDFSIQDNRLSNSGSYKWNNAPDGTWIATKPLSAGPASADGKSETTVTEWDVTSQIQGWYSAWFSAPGTRPGPVFRLNFVDSCPVVGPYYFGFDSQGKLNTSYQFVPYCLWFDLPPGSIRLRLDYDELPLVVGDNLLNEPSVPSYLENIFEDTAHQYDLAIPAGLPRWRAVAVRGNHGFPDLDPGLPTRTGLKLYDYGVSTPEQLAAAAAQKPDQTSFIMIDDHHPSTISAANLKVDVTASNENDYATDLQRNYRIEYQQASPATTTYGVWSPVSILVDSDHLIGLREVQFNQGDNVLIKVSTPITVEVALVEPAAGSLKKDAVFGSNDTRINRNFQPATAEERTMMIGSLPVSGSYALLAINQGPPISAEEPGMPLGYTAYFEILACPKGAIPTKKWGCQPLRLPDSSVPLSMPMPIAGGGSLTIYSEGGFTGSGDNWCTTNEGSGAPIIQSSISTTINVWAFVAQGSICRSGNSLYTTPDSGVGLLVPVQNFNPADKRGKFSPTFIYGDTGFWPVPGGYPDGQVQLDFSGRLVPLVNTRRNIQPFDEYWQNEFAPFSAFDFIVTAEMKAKGDGLLSAQVTVETDQPSIPVSWQVPWELYPNQDTNASGAPQYSFVVFQSQQNPLPMPLSMASLFVRVISNNIADGIMNLLDTQLKAVGPSAFQLRANSARITSDPLLGGATTPVQAVIQPPGLPRQPQNEQSCSEGGTATSCFDIRRPSPDYEFLNGGGEKVVQPWLLPDLHIEDTTGSVLLSQPGRLMAFSADHPGSANAMGQTFSFDTWEATVIVDQKACAPGGPTVTVVTGQGYIALPTLGGDGSGAPPWVKVGFKLCQTNLQEATLTLEVPPAGIPVGSTGFGVYLIGGKVTIGPDYTQIHIEVGFQTLDKFTLTDGKGTVTINTDGLFSLQAKGKLVGVVDAEKLLLQVSWDPLDVLFEGQVSYKSLLFGDVYLHGWIGQGWQNKYSWLPDNSDFHFTGSIQGTVKIHKGDLIDKKYFKLPPFS